MWPYIFWLVRMYILYIPTQNHLLDLLDPNPKSQSQQSKQSVLHFTVVKLLFKLINHKWALKSVSDRSACQNVHPSLWGQPLMALSDC